MPSSTFYQKTINACRDDSLAQKLNTFLSAQIAARQNICTELDDVEKFRTLASNIRDDALFSLDRYLLEFTESISASGINVHWAKDSAHACRIVSSIAQKNNVRTVVKSKSMITEEIELNNALEKDGVEVTETDLGEFIIQLAHKKPSHIVLPAIHLSRQEVKEIFAEKIGYTDSDEPERLTKAAREYLRGKFRNAHMGISGVNFAVAEQGLWTTCTNEGNARFVMTWPKVYVGIMGIERIVKNTDSLAVILKLLARFATGQRITQYTNFVKGPCLSDGPETIHLVLLDNGRSNILNSKYWQMLRCIRCGSCLNVCPVFRNIGGDSFPGTYSGPMGTVLLPLFKGFKETGNLPAACSVCGLCTETCPVKIPLHDFLLELRYDLSKTRYAGFIDKIAMSLTSWVMRHPLLYRLGQRFMRLVLLPFSRSGWVRWLPSVPGKWTKVKDLPLPAKRSFIAGAKKTTNQTECSDG